MSTQRKRFLRSPRPARNGGFTLIELLLVLVILAVLAAVVVPKFTGRTEQARVAAAKADIAGMDLQLDAFEVDAGRYPTTEEGVYRYPGQINTTGVDLFSFGPDGNEGGGDDVGNWSAQQQQ